MTTTKIKKICWQITVAALIQPLQYYLLDPGAKNKSVTHAAATPSNLDETITMYFAVSRRKPVQIYAQGTTK
jgi:uncharacterized membrane protein